MNKICTSLAQNSFDVLLVGFKKKASLPLQPKPFKQKRLFHFFEKGFLHFAEANLRLFFFLLFKKCDIICADDLDTALPVFFATGIRNKQRVYDAHELFCEMHDIVTRPRIHAFWKRIEKFVQPKFALGYAANADYARLYETMYPVHYFTLVNCPLLINEPVDINKQKNILIYQGAIERGRGFEQLIPAMKNLDVQLLVCGMGKCVDEMLQLAAGEDVAHKINFAGFVAPEDLPAYTRSAAIGMNVNDGFGASFYYSLTNRFFDYMHAGIPQIANNNPENRRINNEFEIAVLIDDLQPGTIANAINLLLNDKDLYSRLQQNCLKAREVYNWQNEEKKLVGFYKSL